MKKNEYLGKVSNLSQNEYYKRLYDIMSKCQKVEVFEFEGRYFSGNIVTTIKSYLHENPKKSFWEWLIDNGLEVKQC